MATSRTLRDTFRQRLALHADRLRRLADAEDADTVNTMHDELNAALPQLVPMRSSGEPTREKRRRRVRRTGTDGRRSQDVKVRITALDAPGYITTSRVNMTNLREKGLGRLSETADCIPIEWGEAEFTSLIRSKFPVLDGIQFEVFMGRSGCKLDAIQDLSARAIKSMKDGKGIIRLWVRPVVDIDHNQMYTLTVPTAGSSTDAVADTMTAGSSTATEADTLDILPTPRRPVVTSLVRLIRPAVTATDALVQFRQLANQVVTEHNTVNTAAVAETHVDAGTPTVQFRQLAHQAVTGHNTGNTAEAVENAVIMENVTMENTVSMENAVTTAAAVENAVKENITVENAVTMENAVTTAAVSSSVVALEMDLSAALLNLEGSMSTEQRSLAVSRIDIVTDMLAFYKDSSVLDCRLHVEFLGEPGDDFGGLTKEVFSLFWREVTKSLFVGEHCVVPYLPLHLQRRDSWMFVAMGKILAHTIVLTSNIPPNLSRSFLINLIFDSGVEEECLFADFMEFITTRESTLVKKAITNYDALSNREVERLTNFYTSYRLLDIPRKSEIQNQILAIASQELLQKPSALIKLIRKGIPTWQMEDFWTHLSIDHLTYMLQKQRPTVDKVAECIVPVEEHLNDVEETSLYYLKEFVSGMSRDLLVDFLIFCTSSVHQPEQIKVSFTGLCGLQRRPIAHTCSNTLELPTTYNSFQEFRREFTFLLGTTEAYEYTAV